MRPHRQQPTRLPRPWDSPGKNTGVGCHFLLQCMKVKSESEVTQSCPTLSDSVDCILPGSSVIAIHKLWIITLCYIFSPNQLSLETMLSAALQTLYFERLTLLQSCIHDFSIFFFFWCFIVLSSFKIVFFFFVF